ncbi:patatin-like phospholipase family protein [Clostridium septicum]|uniref:Patatin family protein n=1 Tax=Clostridium septicum TaxID=1504 RepID=A0A9N7JNE5_CLOSE|nr:patatin family protein [Clostridium septicum]AYE35105.1 patatin family protein [Clostridium septicum]MDU1312696.1 patatin family protein [Clostridium septicum]UEC20244.1 patatin family protein [Clostridium septicum]USS01703.1 patatin family protein [Clostridium septicum]WLF70275.1 patatin family protein [Clostridium septicum]
MPSLILEGGTFRPIFSAGVMDALLDNDVMFPYCIGVSAGITNGFSYLSRQKRRNLDILESYRNDKRYLSVKNFFKCKSLFGLDFIFDEIPNKLSPFDMDTFLKYNGTALVGVTNAITGQTEYLDGKTIDEKCTILRATCAIPLFFPAIRINNNYYYDGGICDPIPIQKAISDGNEKHLIILTRPKGYRKQFSRKNLFASKILTKKYPELNNSLLNRHRLYNEQVEFCEKLEREGKALILRPRENQAIESFEKNVDKLREGYFNGYNLAIEKMDEIKNLFL